MAQRKKKGLLTYPRTFVSGNFNWKIFWHEDGNSGKDLFGETDVDSKEIDIYIKNRSLEAVKDTLLHELLHVCLEDLVPVISSMDKPDYDKEEALVRFLTPRLFQMLNDNANLKDFIFS